MFENIINVKDLFGSEPWILKVLTIIFAAFIVSFIAKFILRNSQKVVGKTKGKWDDALIKAASAPVRSVIWIVALKLSIDILTLEFSGKVFKEANLGLEIAVILSLSWFLLRTIRFVSENYIEAGKIGKREADHTTIDAFSKLARLMVFVITVLTIFQNIGISISGILAAGGIGGLAIGFAAKDLLSNLFGGLTIYMDKPFKVGDWIRCNEKNIEGTVEYIGWRHSRLRGFNKNPIYVPNSIFTSVVVENPSRMTNRRINETVGLRYMDMKKVAEVTKKVQEYIENHNGIDQEQNNIINFNSFGASTLDLSVLVFTKTTDVVEFKHLKQEFMLKIAQIVEEVGADMAFPTQTLYVEGIEK